MTTKFLFAIFIADDKKNPPLPNSIFNSVNQELKNRRQDPNNKAGVVKQPNARLDRLEQFGHYYDSVNERIVFFGVADSSGIVNVIDGDVELTGFNPANTNNSETEASKFTQALCEDIGFGLPKDRCTWIVVPLDELVAGHGRLFVEGMAGESGNG